MAFEFTLTALQQRIVAVCLLLVPIGVLLALIYGYASDVAAHREQVVLLERERARYSALAQSAPILKRQIDRLRMASQTGELVFVARSADVAAKQLQAKLSSIVSAAGGTGFQEKAILNANREDGPVAVYANLSFTANIATISKVLFALRQSRPLLIPTRLWIRSAGASGPAPNLLQAELTVVSYSRQP